MPFGDLFKDRPGSSSNEMGKVLFGREELLYKLVYLFFPTLQHKPWPWAWASEGPPNSNVSLGSVCLGRGGSSWSLRLKAVHLRDQGSGPSLSQSPSSGVASPWRYRWCPFSWTSRWSLRPGFLTTLVCGRARDSWPALYHYCAHFESKLPSFIVFSCFGFCKLPRGCRSRWP